jgi:hypothetical protein
MTIAQTRLRTQRLIGPGFAAPADAVRWFGAVQAQDYPGALWAVGMRTKGCDRSERRASADRSRHRPHLAAARDAASRRG